MRDPANARDGLSPSALTSGFGSARIGLRRSASGQRTHYAVAQGTTTDIECMLGASHTARQAVVVFGPHRAQPLRVQVQAQADGNWQTVAEQGFAPDALIEEYRSPLFAVKTDKMRIQVEWAAAGGTIDEIEIWGN